MVGFIHIGDPVHLLEKDTLPPIDCHREDSRPLCHFQVLSECHNFHQKR